MEITLTKALFPKQSLTFLLPKSSFPWGSGRPGRTARREQEALMEPQEMHLCFSETTQVSYHNGMDRSALGGQYFGLTHIKGKPRQKRGQHRHRQARENSFSSDSDTPWSHGVLHILKRHLTYIMSHTDMGTNSNPS